MIVEDLLANQQRSTLRSKLLEEWQDMSDMHLHEEQDPLPEAASNLPTRCNQLGMCVCTSKGLQAWIFQSRLAFCIKPFFTPKRQQRKPDSSGNLVAVELSDDQKQQQAKLKLNRASLEEGFIVLRLKACSSPASIDPRKAAFMHGSWQEIAARRFGPVAPDSVSELWLHLGHVNYTTWASGVLKLDHVAGPDEQGYWTLEVLNPAEASHSVRMFRQHNLSTEHEWQVTVFKILSNTDVLERELFRPDWVLVKEFEEVPSLIFWRGWLEEEKRYQDSLKRTRSTAGKRKSQKSPDVGAEPAKKRAVHDGAPAQENAGPDQMNVDEPHLLEDVDAWSHADSIALSELIAEFAEDTPS